MVGPEFFDGGSSPRVWGALQVVGDAHMRLRLIPTCVGSTRTVSARMSSRAAHPHVCGEHCLWLAGWVEGNGSSPRVWGARILRIIVRLKIRLIPTCVGSTGTAPRRHPAYAAHPHVCGEHRVILHVKLFVYGSSPRVWGAPYPHRAHPPAPRLIPTCVGSTDTQVTDKFSAPAHPHVCGEHFESVAPAMDGYGSSPRVWGALRLPAAGPL